MNVINNYFISAKHIWSGDKLNDRRWSIFRRELLLTQLLFPKIVFHLGPRKITEIVSFKQELILVWMNQFPEFYWYKSSLIDKIKSWIFSWFYSTNLLQWLEHIPIPNYSFLVQNVSELSHRQRVKADGWTWWNYKGSLLTTTPQIIIK